MTSPVAKLVLIALISVIATGLFWWMKKGLGDNTFRSLRHSVTEAYRHTQRRRGARPVRALCARRR